MRPNAACGSGVEVMRVPGLPGGHVDLAAALQLLGTRGITRVFSEGGPSVAEALAQAGWRTRCWSRPLRTVSMRQAFRPFARGWPAALADETCYRLVSTGLIGEDRLQHFERV